MYPFLTRIFLSRERVQWSSTLFPYTTLFRSRCRPPGPRRASRVELLDLGVEGLRRSEEHTSELQSHSDLVCRLLLEKKKSRNPSSLSGARAVCGVRAGCEAVGPVQPDTKPAA